MCTQGVCPVETIHMIGFDRRGQLVIGSIVVVVLLVGGFVAMAGPVAAHEGHDDETEDANVTATIDSDGEVLTLDPAPEQVVTGTTSLEEGSEIAVVLVVRSETPFQRTQQVEVGAGGAFSATFDLGDASPNTPFTLVVEYETDSGTVIASDRVRGTTASTTETSDGTGEVETTATEGQAGPGLIGVALAVLALVVLARR